MRVVLQRVSRASVEVDGRVTGSIGPGLLVLLGISRRDTFQDADYLVDRIAGLRIFPGDNGKMNRNIQDISGELLVVPQFTLLGDIKKGRRPSFDLAAPAGPAQELYNYFLAAARATGIPVASGVFQAHMAVSLVNDGPVTLICDSADRGNR